MSASTWLATCALRSCAMQQACIWGMQAWSSQSPVPHRRIMRHATRTSCSRGLIPIALLKYPNNKPRRTTRPPPPRGMGAAHDCREHGDEDEHTLGRQKVLGDNQVGRVCPLPRHLPPELHAIAISCANSGGDGQAFQTWGSKLHRNPMCRWHSTTRLAERNVFPPQPSEPCQAWPALREPAHQASHDARRAQAAAAVIDAEAADMPRGRTQ